MKIKNRIQIAAMIWLIAGFLVTVLLFMALNQVGHTMALKSAGSGIIAVMVLVTLAAIANSMVMWRTISYRMSALMDSATVIGEGDLDHRIEVKGSDEFADLSATFNTMACNLRKTHLDLEREVVERKRIAEDLEKLNDELERRVADRTQQLAFSIEALEEEIEARKVTEKDLRHSKESHLLAVGSTGIGTFDFNPSTQEFDCSSTTKMHLGIPHDAFCDYALFLAGLHPDDREQTDRTIRDILSSGGGGEYRAIFRTTGISGSQERWIRSNGQVFYNREGQAVRFIGITRDITREKQSEETILRLNHLYAVLSATNHAIVHITDSHQLFEEICRVAVELGGFRLAWVGLINHRTDTVRPVAARGNTDFLTDIKISIRSEPEGRGPTAMAIHEGTFCVCNDFLDSEITRPWQENAAACGIKASASIAIKQNQQVIGSFTLYAGQKNFFDSQLEELLQQLGQEICFALDKIHQEELRKEAEKALYMENLERLRAVEELRKKEQLLINQSRLAAMGEMINNIAHQWRQPLNSLGLLAQQPPMFHEIEGTVTREFLEANSQKSMELIQHMSQTIDAFRNFFKPTKEKVEFSVHEMIKKTLSLMEGSLNQQGIRIALKVKDQPIAFGYSNEFSQVLLNTLTNAKDALSERQTSNPKIDITIGKEGKRAVVMIADNAGGIPEEIMDRIFDPYFTTKELGKGTGIGLFMSKIIIEQNMGGLLSARNIDGGAEFRIEI